jgi:predicted nucleic acid-binding protein
VTVPAGTYFFDSSGIVKRYIDETGSSWVQRLVADHESAVAIAEIGIVEVVAAFARHRRTKELTRQEYLFARRVFLRDVGQYQVVSADREIIKQATDLTDRHPLRAYDAVQLATALRLAEALGEEGLSLTFVSADAQLCVAAEQENLATVNPNLLSETQ